jgi:DNA-binding response OmpR family regulator
LEQDGVSTTICSTGEQALELMGSSTTDLVVLDINLPGIDGFEFLQTLRRRSHTPVIVVSARQADEDIIAALGMGADEFVTKPFAPRVLVARIRAIIRRSKECPESSPRISAGRLELDPDAYAVWLDGERLSLSAKEFEVLRFFLQNPHSAFRPEQIYESVWGDHYGELSAIAVYVQRLRRKLGSRDPETGAIRTIRGVGYLFEPEALS